MKRRQAASLGDMTLESLRETVREVIEDHRRRGIPVAIWRDGRAVLVRVNYEPRPALSFVLRPFRPALLGRAFRGELSVDPQFRK